MSNYQAVAGRQSGKDLKAFFVAVTEQSFAAGCSAPTFLGGWYTEAKEVISMVTETAHNLAALASDETVTAEALDRCVKAADDLENSVTLILTAPWIPRDAPTHAASLHAVKSNLKRVQDDIDNKNSRRAGTRDAR